MNICSVIFSLLMPFCCFGVYHSQIGQDKFVHTHYFLNKKAGVFLDIGAHDGVSLSNTLFFEEELGWTGLCIEPIPEVFQKLIENRNCDCIRGCVTNFTGTSNFIRIKGHLEMLSGLVNKYSPEHLKNVKKWCTEKGDSFEFIEVNCFLLNDLLESRGMYHIDYLSLDTEGGEFDILSSIDFSKFKIEVISVEDNFHDKRFIPFMESMGYKFIHRDQFDVLFVNNDFLLGNNE